MGKLDWDKVIKRYTRDPVSYTKTGKEFIVSKVTDSAIYIKLPSGEEYISRANLEYAAHLINCSHKIEGPADYKRKVADQRPAYAWAILRDMGVFE